MNKNKLSKINKNINNVDKNIGNIFDRKTNNFDFRISKKEAEYILNNINEFKEFNFDIMGKEYGLNLK